MLTGECECYPESSHRNLSRVEDERVQVEFLLQLMRISHAILGITPAKPEHERAFLLGWIVSLLLIIAMGIGLLLFLVPRIMR